MMPGHPQKGADGGHCTRQTFPIGRNNVPHGGLQLPSPSGTTPIFESVTGETSKTEAIHLSCKYTVIWNLQSEDFLP